MWMVLQPTTISALDSYWKTFFGCDVTGSGTPHTVVVPHAGLGDYHGIFLFRRARTLIISIPAGFDEVQYAHLAAMTTSDFDDEAALYDHIPAPIDRIIGPAFIGYADRTTLQPYHSSMVRLLTPSDEPAWSALRHACSAVDWEHGGSPFGAQRLAGCFIDDQLVALAGYAVWGRRIAHMAVITHPAYRGRAYGKGVVSLLSETVLQAGLIPQYRTLCSNTPSMTLATTLGFVAYAESLAVRLA